MKKLSKEFFSFDTEIVAKNLIGKIIKVGSKYGIITETEAYKHKCDEASHAFGRKTPRNSLMYDTYGFVYVYLIYGIYYCLNFTSDKEKPGAVLIRGIKKVNDNEIKNFLGNSLEKFESINGPGKLTKYFGIDKKFNGLDLEKSRKIQVLDAGIKIEKIESTPRIGISKAKDKLWRFVVKE